MEILRSLLFVPAIRERMVEGSARAGADAIVIDLEDSVAVPRKAAARSIAKRWVNKLATPRRSVFVRVNAINSAMAGDDLMATVGKGLRGVVLPKAAEPQDLRDLDVLLREAEVANGVRPGDVVVIPLIESARGLLRAESIVKATERVIGLAIGGEDYTFDIGAARSAEALQHLRATVVQLAAAYDLLSIDTPYPDHGDPDGLVDEARLARAIGLKAKFAIHPEQVSVINRAFTPTSDEVEQARHIVDAFEAGSSDGIGAISVDGRMVDRPIVERARAVIALSKRRR